MKTCNVEGCNNKIWSKGVCLRHSPKTALKKSTKSFKKGGLIAKQSEKGKEKAEEKKEYLVKQFELFDKHWDLKPHYCESCNKWLGSENNLCFHDHLIEKSKRKDIALEIENLFLCCFDCHNLKTNGFPTEKHKKAIEIAKLKYEI